MAETPEGAELVGGEPVRFPTILMRNVYVLPGVPEIFRAKFEALRERFRDAPIHLKNVFVSIGEGELADYLNGLLADFPLLLLGSYPEFSNPEYRVKVTLESRDPGYLEKGLAELLRRLPVRAVVQVTWPRPPGSRVPCEPSPSASPSSRLACASWASARRRSPFLPQACTW